MPLHPSKRLALDRSRGYFVPLHPEQRRTALHRSFFFDGSDYASLRHFLTAVSAHPGLALQARPANLWLRTLQARPRQRPKEIRNTRENNLYRSQNMMSRKFV